MKMNKDSIIDYWACILLRALGPFIRALPFKVSLYLGRRCGELFYYFDLRHKAIAYANIKTAFLGKLPPCRLNHIVKDFYRAYGQNLMEIFFIPRMDKEYMRKYVTFEGVEHIKEGFSRGKGIIFLGVHAGSWELSNMISLYLGFPFSLFVRQQRYPRLGELLNSYRRQKGCRIIERGNQLKGVIAALKENQAVGMSLDQGGRAGTLVDFLGQDASMSSGAIKLAVKYGAALIPVFYVRSKGPYIRTIIEEPLKIQTAGDIDETVRINLRQAVGVFEKYISRYPQEYLWTYKVWKYSSRRKVLILSDSKTGHLRQAEAVAQLACSQLKAKGIDVRVETLQVRFKDEFRRHIFKLGSCFSGRYCCQGCLFCLRWALEEETYLSLINLRPDIIISCGASLSAVNFILSRDSLSKSIVIMRPQLLSLNRFDLVIMPHHDRPPKRRNIAVTEAALTVLDEKSIIAQAEEMGEAAGFKKSTGRIGLGLLIGGDTKDFRLSKKAVAQVIRQVKSAAEKWQADILVTTSRRSSHEIEGLIRGELGVSPYCKFMVIQSEKNFPFAVGGILGLSDILVVSPESISMISEAASSGKYVVVFDLPQTSRHKAFLKYFSDKQYIYLVNPDEINNAINDLLLRRPLIHTVKDRDVISQALARVI
ncbi:MAG: ELM1/GtrOC1 family putative glycosyltransferase [Candidatus Omnitrophota bacterium]